MVIKYCRHMQVPRVLPNLTKYAFLTTGHNTYQKNMNFFSKVSIHGKQSVVLIVLLHSWP